MRLLHHQLPIITHLRFYCLSILFEHLSIETGTSRTFLNETFVLSGLIASVTLKHMRKPRLLADLLVLSLTCECDVSVEHSAYVKLVKHHTSDADSNFRFGIILARLPVASKRENHFLRRLSFVPSRFFRLQLNRQLAHHLIKHFAYK